MIEGLTQDRPGYRLLVHRQSGIVERLSLPGDPAGINLVHRGDLTGFGALAHVPRGEQSAWMAPSGSPKNVPAVHLDERRVFAPVVEGDADRVVCRSVYSGHTLTYAFADDHFDVWLEGDLPDSDQVALDLDVAFTDLRQNDPPDYQFAVQCPYRSADRSLCYVYLSRPAGPGMLLACLTPAAGWRLRYGRNNLTLPAYRTPSHAIHGLQMVARFHSRLDPQARPGPVRLGVRVSFPASLAEARSRIVRELGVPLASATVPSAEIGGSVAFTVAGPAAGAELIAPGGAAEPVALTPPAGPDDGPRRGRAALPAEGFYTLRVWNERGRGSDLVLHAGAPWLETLRRSLADLKPLPPTNAEGSYWIQAMCLARQWFGPDARQDALLYDALVRIHGQGLPPPAGLAESPPTPLLDAMPTKEGRFLHAPLPVPHVYRGKTFSPFHVYEHERVQDPFELVKSCLLAADAFGCDEFLEHAVRIADAHVADNVDATGRIYVLTHDGMNQIDYTSVIAPLLPIVDLARALEGRGDGRANRYRELAGRVADYLVKRGFNFPTEGVSPHVRWTDEGSIACAALSLLYAWWRLERKPAWLEQAGRLLDYHEPWALDAPDVRMLGSSNRYWETQWEGDQEGRSINSGHAWTLWQSEALFYWALAAGDARRLVQSFNGYQTNRCKFAPDGRTFACFTPDFLPDRPRRFELLHDYPHQADRGLAFYLWPRAADTWLATSALVGDEAVNGVLAPRDDGALEFRSHAPFFRRLLVLSDLDRPVRVRAERPVELMFADRWRRGDPSGHSFTLSPPNLIGEPR